MAGVAAVVVAVLALAGSCGGSDSKRADKTQTSKTSTESSITTATTPIEPSDPRPAPTSAEVTKAFQAFVDERTGAGVALAETVQLVDTQNGVVTVTIDPSPELVEIGPYEMPRGFAELFGMPIAFNNAEGVCLRKTAKEVGTVSPSGENLGSMTAEELHRMGTCFGDECIG